MSNEIFELKDAVKTIKTAILKSRYLAARQANAEMLKLYFSVGGYVSANSRKGAWGTGAIETISEHLARELPGLHGFSPQNMRNMRQFFEEWSDISNCQAVPSKICSSRPSEICQPVASKLAGAGLGTEIEIRPPATDNLGPVNHAAFMCVSFTHHMSILRACKTLDERLFYIRKCAAEFWPYRTLEQHLRAHDYEHEGHSVNNFALTMPDAKQMNRAVQSFKDEYLLDFVNIVDDDDDEETLDEPVWMMEMVKKIKDFIHALGPDFCFMDVKKRFIVEDEEYFADLVFFHRSLHAMVAIELKKGKFKPAYLGQLEMYLACLDKFVKHEDENPSIGLVLCHEMKRGVVEMTVRRHNSPMGVATYKSSADVPPEYSALKPLMDGAKRILDESGGETDNLQNKKEGEENE